MEEGRQSRSSGSRYTRSQAAPDWTLQESLTLINEINAIEIDCRDSLPSFQKWKLIVDNCCALGVNRSFNQCRSKWNSLLDEYNKILKWESKSAAPGSYWSLEVDRRKDLGLPEFFHDELFRAIDTYMCMQKSETRTDEDSDTDAEGFQLESFAKTGIKKRKRRMIPMKRDLEERLKPQRQSSTDTVKQCYSEDIEGHPSNSFDETTMQDETEIDEKEQMVAEKLHKNVDLINAVLEGNLAGENVDYKLADTRNADNQTNLARLQGDKLITCLASLADTLNHLCDLVQECS